MEPQEKSNGALIGSVIIIIILIIGGIYFWQTSMQNLESPTSTEGSDNLNSGADLEAELDSIDIESIDEEI